MQACTAELEQLQSHVPRGVPISWYGVASEVRLMGSFDGWSRGVDLSAEEISDSVFTTFRATVPLVPVRFQTAARATQTMSCLWYEGWCCSHVHQLISAGPV